MIGWLRGLVERRRARRLRRDAEAALEILLARSRMLEAAADSGDDRCDPSDAPDLGRMSVADPSEIPDDAESSAWEAAHLFSVHAPKPVRSISGVNFIEAPLALVCPDCDLKQPALYGGRRLCPYCGVSLHVHGSRIYWWRWPAVAALLSDKPQDHEHGIIR